MTNIVGCEVWFGVEPVDIDFDAQAGICCCSNILKGRFVLRQAKAAVWIACVPFHCHGGFFEQVAKILLIRQLLSHAPDHFRGDERWDAFIFSSEDVPDVSDGSCMLGVELVASLVVGSICVLLELAGNANDVAEGCGVRICERHGCLGCNECATPPPSI